MSKLYPDQHRRSDTPEQEIGYYFARLTVVKFPDDLRFTCQKREYLLRVLDRMLDGK